MELIGLVALAAVLIPILELRAVRARLREAERDRDAVFARLETLESAVLESPDARSQRAAGA